MKKPTLVITTIILSLLLLASISIELQTAKAETRISLPVKPIEEDAYSYGITISSPTNTTYLSSSISLNVTVKRPVNPSDYSFKILYSLNGATNATIPSTVRFYDKSTPNSMLSFLGSYTLVKGFISVYNLSEGSHNLTVYGIYEHKGPTAGTKFPALMYDVQSVYFMINNGLPPSIRVVHMQNESCQNNLPIEFRVDEPISWMGYSLDDKTNVTFSGNTTLTGLASGPHKLVVYANDTLGNIGTTGTLNFTITKPEPFLPEVLLLVIVLSTLVVVVTALMLYRRHRKTAK